jgi:hypothetical protein
MRIDNIGSLCSLRLALNFKNLSTIYYYYSTASQTPVSYISPWISANDTLLGWNLDAKSNTGEAIAYSFNIYLDIDGFAPIDINEWDNNKSQPTGIKVYPDPFNTKTTINYIIQRKGLVEISIYDSAGRLINTLINTSVAEGSYSMQWAGKDKKGNNVPCGAYYIKLKSDGVENSKIVYIKK